MILSKKAEIWRQWFEYYGWSIDSLDTSTSYRGFVTFTIMNERIYVVNFKTFAWLQRFERPFFILDDLPMLCQWRYHREEWRTPRVLTAFGLDAEASAGSQSAKPVRLPNGTFETPRQLLARCGVL